MKLTKKETNLIIKALSEMEDRIPTTRNYASKINIEKAEAIEDLIVKLMIAT